MSFVLIFLQFWGVFFFTIYPQHVAITVRIKNWSPENFAIKAKRPPAPCTARTAIPFPQTLDRNHQSSLHLQRQTGCKTVYSVLHVIIFTVRSYENA